MDYIPCEVFMSVLSIARRILNIVGVVLLSGVIALAVTLALQMLGINVGALAE